jgi:hypothetical protein
MGQAATVEAADDTSGYALLIGRKEGDGSEVSPSDVLLAEERLKYSSISKAVTDKRTGLADKLLELIHPEAQAGRAAPLVRKHLPLSRIQEKGQLEKAADNNKVSCSGIPTKEREGCCHDRGLSSASR